MLGDRQRRAVLRTLLAYALTQGSRAVKADSGICLQPTNGITILSPLLCVVKYFSRLSLQLRFNARLIRIEFDTKHQLTNQA